MAKDTDAMDQNKSIWMVVIVALFALLIGYIIWGTDRLSAGHGEMEDVPGMPVACTMEVLECPDGTFVGRSGPSCEFELCPDGTDMNEVVQGGEVEEALPVACTLDVQQCEDGSFVGRVGPNCEFEECPGI